MEITTTNKSTSVENAKQIFNRLIQTQVSEALIADAIEIYAETEIRDDAEREGFVETYSDERYSDLIRKAVLDVVVVVVAAQTVDNEDCFRSIVDMLDVEEQDDTIRRMKVVMLIKMTEDAVEDMPDHEEQRFLHRVAIVTSAIG